MKSLIYKGLHPVYLALLLFLTGAGYTRVSAQDFMMQGWYWDYPKTTQGANWADTLRLKAGELGHSGFTGIWLPPLARASFGNGSNGYDPKDLYDYGEYGGGATGFGTRVQLNNTISALNTAGVKSVADLVFNHRDGGKAEVNPGLASYIAGYNWEKANGGANPFPYDRMRCILPLGGSSGNEAGDYYFKISSASQHSKFFNYEYKVYMQTNTVGWQNLAALVESEPNGGGNCLPSQLNNIINLGQDMNASVDASGCTIDEFHLSLSESDFNAAGDTLFIYFGNRSSGYSDMRIFGIWSGPRSADIIGDLKYQTYTDFSGLPSGQGAMNWSNFKPNNDRATSLEGDWDGMYFFYDYDQFQTDTKTKLEDWTRWNWSDVGIRGLRMDAVKHFTPEFVGDLLDNLHNNGMDPPFVVGEWYSTNTSELAGWVNNVLSFMDTDTKAAISPRIFDFSLRESLRQSCDQMGYDVRQVFSSGLVDAGTGLTGYNVVTFANNHDFRDASGFASLIQNTPMLAYAYLLTNNQIGLPCVFYPDYYGYPDNGTTWYPPDRNGLKTKISQLISLHKSYIFGSTSVTYLNKSGSAFTNDAGTANSYILTYQLKGGAAGKDVVVAINFGGSRMQFHQQLSGLAVGTKLTDIMGVSPYQEAVVQTSENGIPNDIWIDLPARSYAVWVQGEASFLAPLPASDLHFTSMTGGSFSLAWTDNSSNETSFRIERKPEGGSWATLADVSANISSYNDTTISTFEHYYYRVFAVNSALLSGASNEAEGPATWTGATSSTWDNVGNWSTIKVPAAGETVIIPSSGVTNFPVISNAAHTYNHLWIKSGAKLQIDPGGQLTVNGTLLNESGNTGLLVKSGGSLIENTANVNATVERTVNAWTDGLHGWHLLSSPVAGQSVDPAFTDAAPTNYDFFKWDEPSNTWLNQKVGANNITSFVPGIGYLVAYVTGSAKQFTGILNAADISVSGLAQSSGTNKGWHLLGNPYPSAIKWNDGNWALSNITGTAKIWKEADAQYADIAANEIIPSMNGFMVETSGNGSLTIPAAARVHDAAAWYKSSKGLIKLIAHDLDYSTAQESIIKINETATEGFDTEYDSHFLPGYAPHFYSIAGSMNLSTNTLPEIGTSRIIPMGFVKNAAGNFSIELAENTIGNVTNLFLSDEKTGIMTDLSQTPVYKFTSSEGDDATRFVLQFMTFTAVPDPLNHESFGVFQSNGSICITTQQPENIEILVINMLGKVVLLGKTNGNTLTTLNASSLQNGVYIVTLLGPGKLASKKVVVCK